MKKAKMTLVQTEESNPLETLMIEAEKNRSTYRQTLKLTTILSIALLVSIGVNVFSINQITTVKREYFGLDNGRIIPLVPLSEPYRLPADVINYARDGITKAFTMSFSNYKYELEQSRKHFSDKGFESLLSSMESAGFFALLNEKRMNLTATVGTGVLVKQYVENGTYHRIIEMPLNLKFSGQNITLPDQQLIATVRISRIPTTLSTDGIAITQIITKPAK